MVIVCLRIIKIMEAYVFSNTVVQPNCTQPIQELRFQSYSATFSVRGIVQVVGEDVYKFEDHCIFGKCQGVVLGSWRAHIIHDQS